MEVKVQISGTVSICVCVVEYSAAMYMYVQTMVIIKVGLHYCIAGIFQGVDFSRFLAHFFWGV